MGLGLRVYGLSFRVEGLLFLQGFFSLRMGFKM